MSKEQQPLGYYPQQQPSAPSGQQAVTYYPPSGPQQQQPQQLVISPAAPVVVGQPQVPPQSFVGHIIFSCFVCWCCCCPLGLIAFILARE